jgi:hypothetical protein
VDEDAEAALTFGGGHMHSLVRGPMSYRLHQ